MRLPIYQIDAFADAAFQGNPAAVCPLEDWLPDHLLQSIAEENNLSESAFYVGRDGRYRLRWFTPVKEVSLCGHATLAAAHVVFARNPKEPSTITFDSLSGPLRVFKEGDLLTLDFPAQDGIRCDTLAALSRGLGGSPRECYRSMDYMAVFDSEAEVRSLAPDFKLLETLDLRGVAVTAPGVDSDYVNRFFAPRLGINEDPVTGSAHCLLAPYWARRLGKTSLLARQCSKRSGTLRCRVEANRVFISGRAVPYLEGVIRLDYPPKSG